MVDIATLFNPNGRSPRVEWVWKSNDDPWSETESNQWSSYSDIETDIIEQAYQKKLPEAVLDDYHIVFKEFVQISNSNEHQQRPVRRIVLEPEIEPKLRKEHFLADPIVPNTCFSKDHYCTPFFEEFHKVFPNLDNPISNDSKRQELVLKAAQGLIEEGKKLGKQKEGEYMAELLHMVDDGTVDQVYACCAYLYCKESFLYKKLNECMRLVVDPNYDQVWRSKVSTYGPFAQLLYVLKLGTVEQSSYDMEQAGRVFDIDYKTPPFETKQKTSLTVYRGTNLSLVAIQQLQSQKDKIQFTAFTSTTRDRLKAEHCSGNVLFIIDTDEEDDGQDVRSYSNFDEEEYLIHPGFFSFVKSCNHFQDNEKWEIHLRSTSLSK